MKFTSSNSLGLVLSDRAIDCAELTDANKPSAAVRRLATLELPAEISLANPAALGSALGAFLKDKKFTVGRVVIGVPAKWLIAIEKDVPPADPAQVQALLRLQTERMAVGDSGEIVFDYAGELSRETTRVLLVGMRRAQLDALHKMCAAAGLNLQAVTPASLALASAAQLADGPMLVLPRSGGGELVLAAHAAPRLLRHVAGPAIETATPINALGLDLRRAVAIAPGNGSPLPRELLLFDSIGLSRDQLAGLSQRAGLSVTAAQGLARLGVRNESGGRDRDSNGGAAADYFSPAVAVALMGGRGKLLPLDFADPKLAPPTASRFGRRSVWGVAAAALLILLVGGLWINNNLLQRNLNRLNAEQTGLLAAGQAAQAISDRVEFSNGFFKTRPPMLQCLRQIAENFREDDPIWANSFDVREDRDDPTSTRAVGRLEGKTTNYGAASALADRLRRTPNFSSVNVRDISEAGGKTRDQFSFSISFIYTMTPAQTPAVSPATRPAIPASKAGEK